VRQKCADTDRPWKKEPRLAECQDDSIRAVGNAAMKKEGEKTLID